MKPLVSILVPCHNAAQWVEEAVRSALTQTWPHTEVIVIDDGSSDESVAVLKRFGDAIQLIARENRGGNPTRNELAGHARGEWLQFLDADDALLPDKIEKQMERVEAVPAADVIYGPLVIEDHTVGDVVRREWRPHRTDGRHDAWTYHLSWRLTQTGGALFRRSALLSVGGWNNDQACCQDNELFFRLLQEGRTFVHCDHAGAMYRRFSGTSVSTRKDGGVRDEILRLLQAAESWLRSAGEWTPERREAANNYRFGLARQVWPEDRAKAAAIMRQVRTGSGRFLPAPGPHAPGLYRFCFQLFGFEGAERISLWRRKLRPASA